MVLDGCHFKYGGFDSREFGLIFVHTDTTAYNQIAGNITSSYVFNKRNMSRYISDNIYEDSPIEFEAEIMNCEGMEITKDKRRIIEKALFNQSNYQKLYVDAEDDYDGLMFEVRGCNSVQNYFNCRFMNPSKIYDGEEYVRGYRFTVECDSLMLWQDPLIEAFDMTTVVGDPVIDLEIDTDIKEYTYPKVRIEIGASGGDISIANITDDATRLTQFTGLTPNITLVMNGRINYISGQNYEKFTNQNFLRLLDGHNSISINGDVKKIEFEWQNRRFI